MAGTGWHVHVSGTANNPDGDTIFLVRLDAPRIQLEIDAPGLRTSGGDQKQLVRRAIQDVANALQAALDSPSALPGFLP